MKSFCNSVIATLHLPICESRLVMPLPAALLGIPGAGTEHGISRLKSLTSRTSACKLFAEVLRPGFELWFVSAIPWVKAAHIVGVGDPKHAMETVERRVRSRTEAKVPLAHHCRAISGPLEQLPKCELVGVKPPTPLMKRFSNEGEKGSPPRQQRCPRRAAYGCRDMKVRQPH